MLKSFVTIGSLTINMYHIKTVSHKLHKKWPDGRIESLPGIMLSMIDSTTTIIEDPADVQRFENILKRHQIDNKE